MKRSCPSQLLLASALTLGAGHLTAADRTWTGNTLTDPNWSNAGNWDTGAPANNDNASFTGFNQLANNNDLTGLSLGWLQFASGDFVLSGNALTLASGLTNLAGNNAVGLGLTLGDAQTFENQSGTLNLNAPLANGGYALTFGGSADTISANVISGTGGLVKNGFGILTLSGVAAMGNTFTGGFMVNEGSVVTSKANGSTYGGAGNGNVVVNSGGTLRASGDNSLVGQTTSAAKSIRINAGGTVDSTGTTTCHLNALVLNGGTLTATTPNGTWGNWNLDNGVSTLTNGSISTMGPDGNVTLGQVGGTVFNIGAGDTVNVSSVIAKTTSASDLGLIKSGAGLLVLSAENTYASPTLISAGTLALGNYTGTILKTPSITIASNAVFDLTGVFGFSVATNQVLAGSGKVLGTVGDDNAGAVFSPGGNGVAGPLTVETLSLNGNAALNFDLSPLAAAIGGGTNDLLLVTNLSLSAFATNTVSLSSLGGSLVQGVPYTIIKYTSCSAPAGLVTTLAAPPSHFVYAFNNDTANSRITVTITGNPFNLVWKGDGITNAWDITTSMNWLVGGVTPDVYYDGDNTTFNATGSNTPPVNVTTTVKPTTVTVNATQDYSFAGAGKISGGAKLVKSGPGTLTVATDNDFTGGTTLSTGTLAIGAGGGTGNLAGGTGTNNGQIVINRTGTMTSGASLAGTGSLVLVNHGTVNLTGSNSFTGGTLVNNGNLHIGNHPPVAGAPIAGPITNYSGLHFGRTDAFTLQSLITSAGNSFLNGPGNLTLRTTAGITLDGTAAIDLAGSMEVSREVFGRLIVAPAGSINLGGEILLGNPANISGEIVPTGGTVNVGNRIRLGHWSGAVS